VTGLLYAPSTALMDRLGMEPGDAREQQLIQCLDAASRWIETKTERVFYPTASQTRYYTLVYPWHSGGTQITIDDFQSVSALETDNNGDGVFETVWTVGTDYYAGPLNNPVRGKAYTTLYRTSLTGRFYFPAYENSIKVTGIFGYAATAPAPIHELTLLIAELLARPVLDIGMAGAQTYKLGTELTVTLKTETLPPLAQQILKRYAVPGFVV
jgi:hypothetical protein